MPTYDYKCKNCGHVFEEFNQISDDNVQSCPKCGKKAAERQISSGSGLIFKGSGFYITDYSDKKNSNSQQQNSNSSSSDSDNTPNPSDSAESQKSKSNKAKKSSK